MNDRMYTIFLFEDAGSLRMSEVFPQIWIEAVLP